MSGCGCFLSGSAALFGRPNTQPLCTCRLPHVTKTWRPDGAICSGKRCCQSGAPVPARRPCRHLHGAAVETGRILWAGCRGRIGPRSQPIEQARPLSCVECPARRDGSSSSSWLSASLWIVWEVCSTTPTPGFEAAVVQSAAGSRFLPFSSSVFQSSAFPRTLQFVHGSGASECESMSASVAV